MLRSRTQKFLTRRIGQGRDERVADELIVEEPMSIRLDDVLVNTTMRTPGHDFELAAGFCFCEGLLSDPPVVRQVRYCATGSAAATEFNVVSVDSGGTAPAPTPRLGTTSSSCGLCGAEAIEALTARLARLDSTPFDLELLASLPELLEAHVPLFAATGAVHSAGAVAPGERRAVVVREDIGRHNAVDKVIGRLLLDGRLPARDLVLVVSGRASFEMVQKAWAAGFATLVAVSAPSALAVETARAAGLQLAGFARNGRINGYC